MGDNEIIKLTNNTEDSSINSKEDLNSSKVIIHKDIALQKINTLLTNYINNPNKIDKADKLSYWLEDYCNYLDFEDKFDPKRLKSYKRGDVIKANLGYNIGNEEGGLHYCIVADKSNSMSSGIITVIPLTSDKGKPLHFSEVNLGNEIYINFSEKYNNLNLKLATKINKIVEAKGAGIKLEQIDDAMLDLRLLTKIKDELAKMKKGSIAIVSQITTISKQRIYDPQRTGDILSGLRISDESLDLINNKLKQLYVK